MKVEYFYIIHRKQDQNRMINVQKIIDLTPCDNYEIVDEDNPLWFPIEKCKKRNVICMWSKKVVKPIESLYRNHMNIMMDIYKRKLKNVIVYEDDTDITSDFNFDVDLSKIYVNLNVGFHIYPKNKMQTKKSISYEEYLDLNKPEMYTKKYVKTNALFYPNNNNSIKGLIDYMDKYRIKKKNRFRGIDYEIDRMIKLYDIRDKFQMFYKIGFEQNLYYESTLGNIIIKQIKK